MDWTWNLPAYGFYQAYYEHPVNPSHQAVSGYLDWFLKRPHPRVHPIDENVQEAPELEPCAYPAILNISRTLIPYCLHHLPQEDVLADRTTVPTKLFYEFYDLIRVFVDHFHLDDEAGQSDMRN